jgi:uncharacterized delta-60 repeat protein
VNTNIIKRRAGKIIVAASFLLQAIMLSYGAAGDVDLSFDAGSGINGRVAAVAVQPDGKMIIAGEFTSVQGFERRHVARLNADGSGDSSFNAETLTNAYVYTVALQSDGKVLAGHTHGIVRLNSDGSPDTNFVATLGMLDDGFGGQYATVELIVVQPDGRILIGGGFSTGAGTNLNYGLARLHANGSLDGSFDANSEPFYYPYSMALQSDGKVIVGDPNGTSRLHATGSSDASFTPVPSTAYAIAVQPDGKVLIGGGFTTIQGMNRNHLARLNSNGTLDATFDPGTNVFASVVSLALQSDGKVVVGGYADFASQINFVTRLNANGSRDTGFELTAESPDSGYVSTVVLQPDGKVVVGGGFKRFKQTNLNRLARLNVNGSVDAAFDSGTGLDSGVRFVRSLSDGKVLIGGYFSAVRNLRRSNSARLNADGSGDASFAQPPVGNTISAVTMQPDGKMLWGAFGLDRINPDGTRDGSFNPDLGALPNPDPSDYHSIAAVALQPDGKIVVPGHTVGWRCDEFGECGYVYSTFFRRLNSDGSRDTNFTPAISSAVSIIVQPDGKLLVAGSFNFGMNYYALLRLNPNGSLDNSFQPVSGSGQPPLITEVVLQPDGKVLVGGVFTALNGTSRNRIARLNANGTLDSSFNPGTGANEPVRAITVQPDGKVLIGGYFTTINGMTRNRLARLNANGGLDGSFTPNIQGVYNYDWPLVASIALEPDGDILIGGSFFTVNGLLRPNLARLAGNSPLPSLNITRSENTVTISWSLAAAGFRLEEITHLSISNNWSLVTQSAVTNANNMSVTLPQSGPHKWFRLISP